MNRLSALIALLIVPVLLSAKGDTIRITIKGGNLAAPIEITDPALITRFNVWSGPGTQPASSDGTRMPGEGRGLIVDWSRGTAEPPKGAQIYEVLFETSGHNPGTYAVRYLIDPSTNQGYVYIPGKTDPSYRDNTWLIYRGIEGNWFHAWREWEAVAHPLVANAPKTR